jgi:hypothetical protein
MKRKIALSLILIGLMSFNSPANAAENSPKLGTADDLRKATIKALGGEKAEPKKKKKSTSKEETDALIRNFDEALKAITGKGGVKDSTPSKPLSKKEPTTGKEIRKATLDALKGSMDEPPDLPMLDKNGKPIVNIPSQGKKIAEKALKYWIVSDKSGFNSLQTKDATLHTVKGAAKYSLDQRRHTGSRKLITSKYFIRENLLSGIKPFLKDRYDRFIIDAIQDRIKLNKDHFYLFATFENGKKKDFLLLGFIKRDGKYLVDFIEI